MESSGSCSSLPGWPRLHHPKVFGIISKWNSFLSANFFLSMVCYLSVAVKGANCVFDGSFHRATSVDFWWSVFKPPASRGRHSASVFWIQTAHHRFRCEFLLWLVHVPAALCFFSNFFQFFQIGGSVHLFIQAITWPPRTSPLEMTSCVVLLFSSFVFQKQI